MLALIGVIFAYLNSSAFSERAHEYIIHEIEQRTGAKAALRNFDWNFRQQRFRLDDLTLRGAEPVDHAPLAHFARIDIGLNFRSLIRHRVDLFELTFSQP